MHDASYTCCDLENQETERTAMNRINLANSDKEGAMLIVNIGCGASPTDGALNYDNSFSVFLGHAPLVLRICRFLHLVKAEQAAYAAFCKEQDIRCCSCTKIPVPDGSVDVLYTSHMLEHLPVSVRSRFLQEAIRVLRPGGILRILVPDTRILVDRYLADGNCDAFIDALLLAPDTDRSFVAQIRMLLFGHRGHYWMYDGKSLENVLVAGGFTGVQKLQPGETTIREKTGIDLFERADESLYMECIRPYTGAADLRRSARCS